MSVGIPVTVANAAEVAIELKSAKEIMAAFAARLPDGEVKVRAGVVKSNRCLALHYIDARCVMDKLDEVVGIDGWRDEYTVLPSGEVECRLSVKIAGVWITKADVGSQSEQPDGGDRMKAAYSDAMKRAAVKFGIGRFLYSLPSVWMEYDPVKKQPVRPAATAARPQPQPAQQPKPATVDARALNAFVSDLAKCQTKADYSRVCEQIAAGVQSGAINAATREALRKPAQDTLARVSGQPVKA